MLLEDGEPKLEAEFVGVQIIQVGSLTRAVRTICDRRNGSRP
jgi:hypothetical protein